ncbi:MAG: ferredoxin [Solirubrobacterales bacterium]
MTLIPTIDQGACSGHGDCVDRAPGAFALGETAVVIGTAGDADLVAAAEACPALAITLTEQSTGAVIFP